MFKLLFISISGLLWGKWYSQQQDSRVWGEGGSQPHRGPMWNTPRSNRRGLCPWEWAGSVHREQNPLQQLRWSVDHVQQWSYYKVFVMMNEAWFTFHINLIVHVWKCKQKIDCVVIKESCIYFYTDMANLLKFSFFKKSCFDSKSNENIWKIGLNCSSCYKHVLLCFF